MKKLLLMFAVLMTAITASAENYILYTSSNGKEVKPSGDVNTFGANILSNTYSEGQGRIEFDGDVTKIGGFSYKTTLTSIQIPNTVTEIRSDAFSFCSHLVSIDIPASVTTISQNAFRNCSSLASIDIPASVTNIWDYAFYGCTSFLLSLYSLQAQKLA